MASARLLPRSQLNWSTCAEFEAIVTDHGRTGKTIKIVESCDSPCLPVVDDLTHTQVAGNRNRALSRTEWAYDRIPAQTSLP